MADGVGALPQLRILYSDRGRVSARDSARYIRTLLSFEIVHNKRLTANPKTRT